MSWSNVRENRLIHHWMPMGGIHTMTNTCWCRPFLQSEQNSTVVMHHEQVGMGSTGWPFTQQLPKATR